MIDDALARRVHFARAIRTSREDMTELKSLIINESGA